MMNRVREKWRNVSSWEFDLLYVDVSCGNFRVVFRQQTRQRQRRDVLFAVVWCGLLLSGGLQLLLVWFERQQTCRYVLIRRGLKSTVVFIARFTRRGCRRERKTAKPFSSCFMLVTSIFVFSAPKLRGACPAAPLGTMAQQPLASHARFPCQGLPLLPIR